MSAVVRRLPAAFGRLASRTSAMPDVVVSDQPSPATLSRVERLALVMGSLTAVSKHIRRPLYSEAVDGSGRSPLMLAASYGHVDLCEALIEAGLEPERRDGRGLDALAHAEQACHTPVVEYLQKVLAGTNAAAVPSNPDVVSASEEPVEPSSVGGVWDLSGLEPTEEQAVPPESSIIENARDLQNLLIRHVASTDLASMALDGEVLTGAAVEEVPGHDSGDHIEGARHRLEQALAADPQAARFTIKAAELAFSEPASAETGATCELEPPLTPCGSRMVSVEDVRRCISSLCLPLDFLEELCSTLEHRLEDHAALSEIRNRSAELSALTRERWQRCFSEAGGLLRATDK